MEPEYSTPSREEVLYGLLAAEKWNADTGVRWNKSKRDLRREETAGVPWIYTHFFS